MRPRFVHDQVTGFQGDVYGQRLTLWREALEVFKVNPWLGAGVGYRVEHTLLMGRLLDVVPHNIVIHMLSMAGIFSAVFLSIISIWYFRAMFKGIIVTKCPRLRATQIGLFSYILSICAYNMVGLSNFQVMLLCWFSISALYVLARQAHK